MNPEQRALRNRLRAHGRQLGDRRHAGTGRQGIDHLVHECAYEHWHSMLFARFLAENHLLIEPNTGVAVTLQECDELAQEDEWTGGRLRRATPIGCFPRCFAQTIRRSRSNPPENTG